MIEEFLVRGIGGIKEAQLSLNGNFIVITGESGSGKSSLVRAMEFITGKRAQTNMIHSLEDSCYITMTLSADEKDDTNSLLEAYKPQDGTIIIERTFNKSGRGKSTIQGIPVPLNILSFLMEKKVVIQSQFAQLDLIEPSKQLQLVDSFGSDLLKKTAKELSSTFNSAILIEKELLSLRKKRREMEEIYQDSENILRQIHDLELLENSEEIWQKELDELENTYKLVEAYKRISQRLLGTASGDGLFEELEELSKQTYSLAPDDVDWHKCIEEMLLSVQNFSTKLNDAAKSDNGQDEIEKAQEHLEKKIGIIRKIKRTLGLSNCKEVLDYVKTATDDIAWLKESNKTIENLVKQADELKKDISTKALELRKLRKESAKALSERVNANLNDMAMEYATFNIEIEGHDKVRSTGAENASFTLALQNQSPLPVAKNASGGELSRILIALQLSLGESSLPETLIFDEVEAGLGGKTALLAGYKLKELSQKCRTILITHEATIAAMADQHYLVERTGDDTNIKEVKGAEREREIARMLAGDETSTEAIKHAHALLENQ
ncbi:MAG: DNA recombination protein RecN [Synergistaceae bacterium]|nr:DNA recombination protein RecN [Synergistaceae bacterium]